MASKTTSKAAKKPAGKTRVVPAGKSNPASSYELSVIESAVAEEYVINGGTRAQRSGPFIRTLRTGQRTR